MPRRVASDPQLTPRGVTNVHGWLRLRTDSAGRPTVNTKRPLNLTAIPSPTIRTP